MTIVKPGVPVQTTEPILVVDIDPAAPMLSGKYTFQLVVRDSDGAVSDATNVTVVVLDNIKPTAVIDGPPVQQAAFGAPFQLTAKGSHANAPAQLREFTWTLLGVG
jgi:hypothetical protein